MEGEGWGITSTILCLTFAAGHDLESRLCVSERDAEPSPLLVGRCQDSGLGMDLVDAENLQQVFEDGKRDTCIF